jgi:hypothetical protein
MGRKPYDIASTTVARIHPLVVQPVTIRVSIPFASSIELRSVPKNAEANCL